MLNECAKLSECDKKGDLNGGPLQGAISLKRTRDGNGKGEIERESERSNIKNLHLSEEIWFTICKNCHRLQQNEYWVMWTQKWMFFDKWAQLLPFSLMVIRLTNIWRIFVSDWTNAYTINDTDEINGKLQRLADEIRNKNCFAEATNYTWLPMNANNKLITNHFSLFRLNLLSVAFYRRLFLYHVCTEQMDFVNDANDDQC